MSVNQGAVSARRLAVGALAAGAAVMAWRKSNERPDPWASAGSYTPPKSASEKVSDLAGAAKDKAVDVKDAATAKAGELKDKAVEAKGAATAKASDVKDAAGDKATELKDKADEATAGDDGADAVWADANVSDDSIASTSGTSEGSDLSTPNLDGGSDEHRA